MVLTLILAVAALALLTGATVALLREVNRATEVITLADNYRVSDFAGDVEAWLRQEGY